MQGFSRTEGGVATGYFGVPGREGGLVHLAKEGRPMCGTRLHPQSEFQWCCAGINSGYLECEKCARIASDLLFAQFEQRVAALNPRTKEGRRERERLEDMRRHRGNPKVL